MPLPPLIGKATTNMAVNWVPSWCASCN